MIRRPPRSTLFPTRRSSDLVRDGVDDVEGGVGDGEGLAAVVDPAAEHAGEDFRRGNGRVPLLERREILDRKSTRLNSSHANISYAVFCLKKKNTLPLPSPPM